jgi:beta-lactamase class A
VDPISQSVWLAMIVLIPVLVLSLMFSPIIAADALSTVAIAQVISQPTLLTPEQALTQLFQVEAVASTWFAPSFLQQVPFAQIQPLIDDLKQSLGTLQSIQQREEGYGLVFERGTLPARIRLDAQGRIDLLFFGIAETPISLEEAIALVQAFPGRASLLVLAGDQTLAAVNADEPLAVGSAFKLAVLAALRQEIDQGRLAWGDVVALQPGWRSLPSGLIQDWPVGSALTVETLATLMISLSDNTATDALIEIVGRAAIAALTPRNQPFLTTREFFALKNPANAAYLQQFREGNADERLAILSALATAPLPDGAVFSGNPVALDVEWFFSAQELCALMTQVQDLPLMGVNPGVARPQDWQALAFKGGSEPGVLNLTTGLTTAEGLTYCVAATWNDDTQPLDEGALTRLYSGLVAALGTRSPQ